MQVIDGSGNRTFLEKRDTSYISEFNGTGATGTPKYYANWDDFNILVAPVPATALEVQINYIKDPPEFTSLIKPLYLNIKSLCYYTVY